MTGDWHDPFAEDGAARERERRRAEREARRRGRQGSLGEKVEAQQQAATTLAEPAAPEWAAATEDEPAATARQAATSQPPPAGPVPAPQPLRRPRRPGSGGVSPTTLWVRRLVAVLIVAGAAALFVFGASKVIDRLGAIGQTPPVSDRLAKGLPFSIPEGLDRHQIAEVTKKEGLKGDYEEATKRFKGFDPAKYGAKGAPNLEGFLFPATYELPKQGSVKDLIAKQLDEGFRPNVAEVDFSYAKSKNLSVYDVLKIASMVEREIQVPEERKLAAAVIYNRLAAGTPLGIDATIRYEDQNYDEQLVESRLNEDTPYNTRIRPGLPPTPIGNPGLASIEAAANPAKSDVFFFVVKPGTCGEHVFVETEAEFAAAEADYQAALQAQGGSPTEC